jgi:Plasmid pRiA4b ORF-3-like protein
MADTGTHVFRVSLESKVYRDIEIQSAKKLYDLAGAIVGAFGFYFDHPFGFYSLLKGNIFDSPVKYELFADLEDIGEPSDAGSVERTRISAAFPEIGHEMTFLFDYGHGWRFHVVLIGASQKERGMKYPRVVKKAGRAPKQYPKERRGMLARKSDAN